MAAGPLEQDGQGGADAGRVEGRRLGFERSCSCCSRADFTGLGDLPPQRGRGRARAAALYLNEKAWAKPISSTSRMVAAKSASLSPGKPTMKSDDSARSGRAARSASTSAPIVVGRVAAVHRLQHGIGARLHRQMQERHQLRHVAMGADQLRVHVARVRGGVAQPGEPGDLGQRAQQAGEAPGRAVRALAVVGVDVLAQQRELARTAGDEAARLAQDVGCRAGSAPRRACRARRRRCRTCRSLPGWSGTR